MDLPSDDLIREHAYLVARGVRPLALVATGKAERLLRVATQVEAVATDFDGRVIPFVLEESDGRASCGFASHGWVLDLYAWCVRPCIPRKYADRVIGLLLGYDPGAVARFEAGRSGRLFPAGPTALAGSRSSSPRRHKLRMA